MRADTPDGQFVCLTLVVELDGTADRVIGAGTAATCRGEEGRTLEGLLGVVSIDGGGDQCDVRATSGAGEGARAVEPAGIRGCRDDLVAIE